MWGIAIPGARIAHEPEPVLVGWTDDATLEQHLLHGPKTQEKSKVEPNGMSDDLGRNPVALVADGIGHAAALKPQAADRKLP